MLGLRPFALALAVARVCNGADRIVFTIGTWNPTLIAFLSISTPVRTDLGLLKRAVRRFTVLIFLRWLIFGILILEKKRVFVSLGSLIVYSQCIVLIGCKADMLWSTTYRIVTILQTIGGRWLAYDIAWKRVIFRVLILSIERFGQYFFLSFLLFLLLLVFAFAAPRTIHH